LTRQGLEQFLAHLQRIESDPGVRALVLTGAGQKTFCSGAALDEVQAGTVDGDAFQVVADRLAALPIPKLAAMNGSAYGGGTELGLCCDFRYGVEDMKIRVPAACFGLCYPPGGIRRYVSRLGVEAAKRILVAAETIEAPELLRMGFLHRVCTPLELPVLADEWARRLSRLAPLAVRAMLAICNGAADDSLDAAQMRQWVDRCNRSADLQEGLQAALEKREPRFRGR
jgi:enoyl-CoA hydratase/carnithine racemase